MSEELQKRHQGVSRLERPRELVVACPPMRSNVNLSRIVRAAGCCGVRRVIACGTAKVIGKIARDFDDALTIETHRTLPPVLKELQSDGYRLVALEQAVDSHCLYDYAFPRRSALVVGNERLGVAEDVLRLVDDTVEIPVYGRPDSHNAATATAMALYEYCRQYPSG